MKSLNLLYLPLALSLFCSSAYAQTTFDMVPDRRVVVPTLTNSDLITFRANAGSSYCCDLQPSVGITTAPFFGSTTVAVSHASGISNITGRFAGESPHLLDGQGRVCFIIPRNLDQPSPTLTVSIAGGGSISNASVECRETTLFGGFNTSVTDFNFLEITNTLDSASSGATSRELSCTVTAINTVPTPDTIAIDQQSVTVAAGSRTDVDIHTAAGAGAFGPVILACNGAPGSIKAVINQYNITSTSPLDFSPVAQDVLRTRASLAGPGGS